MPVVGKTGREIAARAAYFKLTSDLTIREVDFADKPIGYHPRIHDVTAEAYFAVSEAFKREYLGPNHRSEPAKIAALTCAVISMVRPIRYVDPGNVVDEAVLYVNAMVAMRAAVVIIDHPFHKRAFDDRRRFYRMLREIDLPCLTPILDEANQNDGVLTSNWQIQLQRSDRTTLNGLVTMFSVLAAMPVMKRPSVGLAGLRTGQPES